MQLGHTTRPIFYRVKYLRLPVPIETIGCNKVGQLNIGNTTTIEAQPAYRKQQSEEPLEEENSKIDQEEVKKNQDYARYQSLWTIQNYLSNPPSVSVKYFHNRAPL